MSTSRRSDSDFTARLIALWLACTAVATLAPFDFMMPPPGERWAFTTFSDGSAQQEPLHVFLNVVLFVPLGVLLYRARRHALSLLSILLLVAGAGLLISFTIECLQRLLPGRESSIVDVAANTSGALGGALIGALFSRILAGRTTWFAGGSIRLPDRS